MAKLGSVKRPIIVRVQTEAKGREIVSVCNKHGLQVIVGIEPGEPEDIYDLEKALSALGRVAGSDEM
jgi:hypothetical protein